MRALALAAIGLLLASCGDREAAVLVEDVDVVRTPDNHIGATVHVTASEQSGKNTGRFCVSVHWFVGDPSVTPAAPGYPGSYEELLQCDGGLEDGDRKRYVFLSTRTDIPPGTNLRAQTVLGDEIEMQDFSTP
jgi:hypothetical protein